MDNDRMTFSEIMKMINNACNGAYYNGAKGKEETIIKCATDIYIAQMKKDGDTDG